MARGLVFNSRILTRDVYRALQQVRNLGENPAPLLEIFGGILEASTRNRFDTSRGPGGVPWPPSKRVLGVGTFGPANGRTLVDKGNLERAVKYEVQPRRLLVGVDGVGESVKHAASHQFGVSKSTVRVTHFRLTTQAFGVPLPEAVLVRVRGHRVRMNLPARPFLGVDNDDRRELTAAARAYVRSLLK